MCASLLLSIFIPDLYIPKIIRFYKKKVEISESEENSRLYFLPKHLGWVERTLYWLCWFFLKSQFVIFLGVWLALKVVGNYTAWGQEGDHKGRARYIIFMIGTSLSIISVIVIALVTPLLIIWFGVFAQVSCTIKI